MTIPKFDEFMWRALASGQSDKIPAMIRNADTLNGYATGVGSAVAHAENEQLHASYAENATAEQRLDLQRQANRAENAMEPYVRTELQGARTGHLVAPTSVPAPLNFEQQLALLQANPEALTAQAKIAECNARIAEAESEARAAEAQTKLDAHKADIDEKKSARQDKYKHEQDLIELKHKNNMEVRQITGLRPRGVALTDPSPVTTVYNNNLDGIDDLYSPKDKSEAAKIAIFRTLEIGRPVDGICETPLQICFSFIQALQRNEVPHSERYDMEAWNRFTIYREDEATANQAFTSVFPNAIKRHKVEGGMLLTGVPTESRQRAGWKGVRFQPNAFWNKYMLHRN